MFAFVLPAKAEEGRVQVISLLGKKPQVFSVEPGFPGRYRWLEEEIGNFGIDEKLADSVARALASAGKPAIPVLYEFDRDALYAKRSRWFNHGYDKNALAALVLGLQKEGVAPPFLLLVQHRIPVVGAMGDKTSYGYGLMRNPRQTMAFVSVRALFFCEPERVCAQDGHWEYMEVPGFVTSRPLADPSVAELEAASTVLDAAIPRFSDELVRKLRL